MLGELLTAKDFNKALNSGFVEFVGAAQAFLLNKYLGILLKERKDDKIVVQYDVEHPEKYAIPKMLWNMVAINLKKK